MSAQKFEFEFDFRFGLTIVGSFLKDFVCRTISFTLLSGKGCNLFPRTLITDGVGI